MIAPLISSWLAALTGRSGQPGRLVLFDLCQLRPNPKHARYVGRPRLPIQRHSQTVAPTIKTMMPGTVDPRSHHEAVRMTANETTITMDFTAPLPSPPTPSTAASSPVCKSLSLTTLCGFLASGTVRFEARCPGSRDRCAGRRDGNLVLCALGGLHLLHRVLHCEMTSLPRSKSLGEV